MTLKFKMTLKRWAVWFIHYFVCFIALVIVTSTIKNLYGSLRPFFFAVCVPDAAQSCLPGHIVTEYNCTGTKHSQYEIFEANRSFPSGHVYSVSYCSFVLILYIHSKLDEMPSKLFVVLVYLAILLWTCFCCVTRVTDNWHHPVDVIGAVMIAFPFAFYSVRAIASCLLNDNKLLCLFLEPHSLQEL
jgi:phosphatidate phosphatase